MKCGQSMTPKCDKCEREITTGIMAGLCPHGSDCELWTKDLDAGAEVFLYQIWEGFAKEHVAKLESSLAEAVAALKEAGFELHRICHHNLEVWDCQAAGCAKRREIVARLGG